MQMFYASWERRERISLGLAVIAFMYAGAKLWIGPHHTESVVPFLVGLVFSFWLIGQRGFKNKPVWKGISFAVVYILAAFSAYAVFHYR